ncbi:MAG: pyruvate kinase [Methylococcaceae bacterium]|nr:pyruvate kinase [Methylococcaceae bacterium]MCI0734236.1 pyruvate kinase [Methylococcaceae bacterium]
MLRRTKIVATLGPSTDKPGILEQICKAGLDVARLNFAHGTADDQRKRAKSVRQVAEKARRHIGILADLQGPKIRIARFKEGKVILERDARFVLDLALDPDAGDQHQVGCLYTALASDLTHGDVLMLDDGRVVLRVDRIEGSRVECRVIVGGDLSNHKGINLQGGGLSAPALTDKDREDIQTAAEIDADYVAVSFPRCAADIHEARRLLRAAGSDAGLVAKIERAEALDVIEEIIEASDGIMVARGDLGVEIGDATLPAVQKHLIELARKMDTAVIIATQMMESMIHNPLPTRAEVFDVANAIFDGTDAVMLSAETAAGNYPVKAVEAMRRVCLETEKQPGVRVQPADDLHFSRVDEAIAKSAMYIANHTEIKAIMALTESGATPIWMSRLNSSIPIFAMTAHAKTCQKVTLLRGVHPLRFKVDTMSHAVLNKAAIEELEARGLVSKGDLVILTKGDLTGVPGGTNAMKIIRIGDELIPE